MRPTMLMRNLVCSVVTIAVLWAFARSWNALGTWLTTGDSFTGLGEFAACTAMFGLFCCLIARSIDAREALRRAQRGRPR